MRAIPAKVSATIVAVTVFTAGAIAAGPASGTAHAAPEATAPQHTSEALRYKDLDAVSFESERQGLSTEATAIAVELQRIVNAYLSLPAELQGQPTDSPRVTEALNRLIERMRQTRELTYENAKGCITALASALSIAIPAKTSSPSSSSPAG